MDIHQTGKAQATQKTETSKPIAETKQAAQALTFLAGAKSTPAAKSVEQAKQSASKMTSLLKSGQPVAKTAPLAPPTLPQTAKPAQSKAVNFWLQWNQRLTGEVKADMDLRQTALRKAGQQKTRDGLPFDANADVTALYEAGRGKVLADNKALLDVIGNRTPDQLKALELVYKDRVGGDLWKDVKDKMNNSGDWKKVEEYRAGKAPARSAPAKPGPEVPPEKQLQNAISGKDKSAKTLTALIEAHGPDKARLLYAEATKTDKLPKGRDLAADIKANFGGRDRFLAETAMKGEPQTAEEMVKRARERAQFENPKGDLLAGAGGAFTETDEIMWKNVERAETALTQLQIAEKTGDAKAAAVWKARVGELTGYTKHDAKVYAGEKDGAVQGYAMVATTAAAVGATVVTGGLGAPAAFAATAAITGTTNVVTRAALQGSAYDHNKIAKDFATGAIDGLGAKAGSALGGMARNAVASKLQSQVLKTWVGATVGGAVDGALGGAASGAFARATAQGTWDNGLLEGLGKVGEGALISGTVGAVVGGVVARPSEIVFEKVGDAFTSMTRGSKPVGVDVDRALTVARETVDLTPAKQADHLASWQTQTFKESPAYLALDQAQRAKFDSLVDGIASKSLDPDKTGAALVGLMESGRIMAQDANGSSVLDHLVNLRGKTRLPELQVEANHIFDSTLEAVNNPGLIHQGQRGTCAATSVQILHATGDPADYVRVIDGLTSAGKVQLKSGTNLWVNDSSLAKLGFDGQTGMALENTMPKDYSADYMAMLNRTPSSRIYQSAAMQHMGALDGWEYDNLMQTMSRPGATIPVARDLQNGHLGFDQDIKLDRGGFRVNGQAGPVMSTDPRLPGQAVMDGMSQSNQKMLMEDIFGVKFQSARITPEGREILRQYELSTDIKPDGTKNFDLSGMPKQDVEHMRTLVDAGIQAQSTGKPAVLSVQWNEGNPASGHAVALVGFTNDGRFIIKNPQLAMRDTPDLANLELIRDPQALGLRGEFGYSAVAPWDLLGRLRGVVAQAP